MFRRKTRTACPAEVHVELITLMKNLSKNQPGLQKKLRRGVTVNANTAADGERKYRVIIDGDREHVEVL